MEKFCQDDVNANISASGWEVMVMVMVMTLRRGVTLGNIHRGVMLALVGEMSRIEHGLGI